MRRCLAALVFCLCASLVPAAQAGTLLALDLAALVEQSDYVVVANADKASSRYAQKQIVTDVTLKVVAGLKGPAKPGDTLTATHLGGSVGDVALRVPGAARFELGRSAVVFLRRAAQSGELRVTGMGQGVLTITGNGADAQAVPVESGGTFLQRDDQGTLQEAPARSPRRLADLLTELEQLISHK